ncbi:MAG: DUF1761 domain-containing protein [Myxococcota bacterium]|jgi:hypothetical protein
MHTEPMNLASLSWSALATTVFVSFVGGFLWFGPKTFFPVWWRAMGKSEAEIPGGKDGMALVFGLTLLGIVVQNAVLGLIIGMSSELTPASGAFTGFVAGTGLAAFSSLSHRMFAGQGLKVWLIEVTSDVVNLTLAGAVFGWFGKP